MICGSGAVRRRLRRSGFLSRSVFLARLRLCLSFVVLGGRRLVFSVVFAVLSVGGGLCGVSVLVVFLFRRLSLLARVFRVSVFAGWRAVLFVSAFCFVLRSVFGLGGILGGFRFVVARLMPDGLRCGAIWASLRTAAALRARRRPINSTVSEETAPRGFS